MDTDIPLRQITGLVLAGGRGSRMGGVDKGLEVLGGQPLVWHALERLRPQVGALAINANRHAEAYARFDVPVWPDAQADFPGPLAGMLAGLTHCQTEWLVTVPCDTPLFPIDLVARLYAAARAGGVRVAMPVTEAAAAETGSGRADARSGPQPQPVFCLMHRSLRAPLEAALAAGERKIERFTRGQGQVLVPFAEGGAFFNANTPDDLEQLRAGGAAAAKPPRSA
ncbi:MAG: molybdenum cofactor guanylyltransferase MobA [Rubrivivax sp.]|nr:molybdenum cofactor guanylyltransferase MobA [Rubrivivax sp.]